MTGARGWSLPESHLLPDAIVALVDGELSAGAHDRALSHIAHCADCAADVAAQRQARTEVQFARAPGMSAGFLASLRSIPHSASFEQVNLGMSSSSNSFSGSLLPENLAVTDDGQLVLIQRSVSDSSSPNSSNRSGSHRGNSSPSDAVGHDPAGIAGLRDTNILGSSAPLGSSPIMGSRALGSRGLNVSAVALNYGGTPASEPAGSELLDSGKDVNSGAPDHGVHKPHYRKRMAQGAGVVVSGLVLSALALTAASSGGAGANGVVEEPVGGQPKVLRAQLGGSDSSSTDSTSVASPTAASSTPLPTPSPSETLSPVKKLFDSVLVSELSRP